MSYINDALLQTNHHKKLKDETKAIVSKWEKTGLLEGLDSDYNKSGMASLLENQARQLIDEASRTGEGANQEQWAGVALPLVRRIFAEIAAQDFVSVQPMNLPSGLVFYLDFKYGSTQSGRTTSESVYGKTGPFSPSGSSAPYGEKGFYGTGKYGYTVGTGSAAVTFGEVGTELGALATLSDINFDSELTGSVAAQTLFRVTGSLSSTDADKGAVRGW